MDRYRWVVGAATLTRAASAFVFLGVGTLAAFVQIDLDLSGTRTGLLVTAVGLVPLLALLPVGRMLDRFGERCGPAAHARRARRLAGRPSRRGGGRRHGCSRVRRGLPRPPASEGLGRHVVARPAAPAGRPCAATVLWTGTAQVATQFATVAYLLAYLRDRHGVALAVGGGCLFAAQMAGVVGRVALARWSDRFGAGRRLRPSC